MSKRTKKTYKRISVRLEEKLYEQLEGFADAYPLPVSSFAAYLIAKGVAGWDTPMDFMEKKQQQGSRAKAKGRQGLKIINGVDISDLVCRHASHGDYGMPAKDCRHLEMHWRMGEVHDQDLNEIPWEENDEG